jgi:hypothetical protein
MKSTDVSLRYVVLWYGPIFSFIRLSSRIFAFILTLIFFKNVYFQELRRYILNVILLVDALPPSYISILSRIRGVIVRLGTDWMIEFIDTLYTLLGTTGSYNATAHFTVHRYTHTSLLQSPLSIS